MKWTQRIERFFRNKNGLQNSIPADTINQCQNDKQVQSLPIEFNINMLVITDTHGCLEVKSLPNERYDVCLLLGDFSTNDLKIIKDNITETPIYGVLGNHDSFELYDICNIQNIHGKVVEVNGIKIAGLQGSIKYKNTLAPLYDDNESVMIADAINKADILISHDSPKYLHADKDYAHSGLQGITHYCEKHNIPLNIHGHHHENSKHVLANGTTSICCYGICTIKIQSNQIFIEHVN